MSDNNMITAEIREDVGKGASRRLRRAGYIPAVIYGGEKESVALTLEHKQVLHATESESFFSSIQEIQVGDGRRQQVVVRDMHRHPFKQIIMHLDFMRVSATEVLRISLPLHFMGEEESPAGIASGVVIQHLVTDMEVAAMPGDLPEYLEVDLSDLDVGDAVMLADIKLPKGVEIPSLTDDEESNVMVANAIHISEDQGTGAAAAAEAEAIAAEEGELAVDGEAVEGETPDDVEGDEGDAPADGEADKE
jgi:large subunit ribosomal protein L25